MRVKAHSIVAAQNGGGSSTWVGSSRGDDFNRDYSTALPAVIQRSQDLDVNNPDVHGFHLSKTGQVIGRGLRFSTSIRGAEIGLGELETATLNARINDLRELHSMRGGFDSVKHRRSEGKLMEIAQKTCLAHGSVLVHRRHIVDATRLHPLAVEIIPVTRLETPPWEMGSDKVSQGIVYNDDRRSEVVGFWVRKPARTIGNAYVKTMGPEDYQYIPWDHAALLMITEIAGQDRSLPAVTCCVKSLRNQGEFLEATLETARAHAKREGFIKGQPGSNAFDNAEDDAEQSGTATDVEPVAVNSVTVAGTYLTYLNPGEEYQPATTQLPTPMAEFITTHKSRQASGLGISTSRYTRQALSSYSGGRQEEQQDEPLIDQTRESFMNAWGAVTEWFMDGIFMDSANNKIELPGYSEKTKPYFLRVDVTPMSPKLAINPIDQVNADRMELILRTKTPQQACAERGKNFYQNIEEFARAIRAIRKTEEDHKLAAGTLDFLLDVPTKEAAQVSNRDGDGDGIVGEGKQGRGGGTGKACSPEVLTACERFVRGEANFSDLALIRENLSI